MRKPSLKGGLFFIVVWLGFFCCSNNSTQVVTLHHNSLAIPLPLLLRSAAFPVLGIVTKSRSGPQADVGSRWNLATATTYSLWTTALLNA